MSTASLSRLHLAPLLAVVLIVGCSKPDTPATAASRAVPAAPTPSESGEAVFVAPRHSAEATDSARPIAPGSRPETATGTVQIEGMDEPIDLRLVTVEDTPLDFSTYVPADWRDGVAASGEGSAVQLTMGEPPLDGLVSVFVPSEGNRSQIGSFARAVAESRGSVEPLGARAPWVRSGYQFSGDGRVGSVRIGRHAGVPFYVVTDYPAEMGDGFSPRAALVLDRLRWADDGTGL